MNFSWSDFSLMTHCEAVFGSLVVTYIVHRLGFFLVSLPREYRSYKPILALSCVAFFYYFTLTTYTYPTFNGLSFFYMALAVTMVTDAYTFLISSFATTRLIPLFLLYVHLGYLPVTLKESVISIILIWCGMRILNYLIIRWYGKEGLGEGDTDLLLFIACALGILPTLTIIMYASLIGSAWGIYNVYIKKEGPLAQAILPFGTCLGYGAFIQHFIPHALLLQKLSLF